MWYHFAFVAVSVALFGMTAGALLVHLLPDRFPKELTNRHLFYSALLFSLTIVGSFVLQLQIPFDPAWSLTSILQVAVTYLVISTPFVFSGITVCLALTRFPGQVSRLYAVDLIGAALGTITLIWLLGLLKDGPSAVIAVAAIAAVGAALFAYREIGWRGFAVAGAAALAATKRTCRSTRRGTPFPHSRGGRPRRALPTGTGVSRRNDRPTGAHDRRHGRRVADGLRGRPG